MFACLSSDSCQSIQVDVLCVCVCVALMSCVWLGLVDSYGDTLLLIIIVRNYNRMESIGKCACNHND